MYELDYRSKQIHLYVPYDAILRPLKGEVKGLTNPYTPTYIAVIAPILSSLQTTVNGAKLTQH